MAKAAAAGHRVVLVVATRGELGEPVPGVLADGEPLWQRRVQETHRSAEILGVERVEFLGYVDSGMMGEPTNDDPECFWKADLDEAAKRLATILRDVDATVLTIYDEHGAYGHPDHIQVHRVGRRAGEITGLTQVYEATMNRERIIEMVASRAEIEEDLENRFEEFDPSQFGTSEADITHAVDVSSLIDLKRKAMMAHESQISDESFFLQMPDDVFSESFGTEWFIRVGGSRDAGAPFVDDLFDGADPSL